MNDTEYVLKEFDKFYTGNQAFNTERSEGCEGRMETYGEHYERVREQFEKDPHTVWTIVEADDPDSITVEDDDFFSGLIVIPGLHHVNRLLYFVSNERWTDENVEYAW